MAEKCQAMKADETPCGAYVIEGSKFCFAHTETEAPEEAPEDTMKPKNTGGAIYRTTRGFSGVFVIIESRILEREADGSRQWNRSMKLPIVRLGVEKATLVPVGIVDTRNLSSDIVLACEEKWGEKTWREPFDKLVKKRAAMVYLEEIGSADEIVLSSKDRQGPDVISNARLVSSMQPSRPKVEE